MGESVSTNEFGAVVILDIPTLVTIPPAVVKGPTLIDAGERSDVAAVTPGTELNRCGVSSIPALPHPTQAMAAPQSASFQRFTAPAY